MERIWFSVDFNELIDRDLVMLSQSGTRLDSRGRPVTLYEGLPVTVYEEDVYEDGTRDFLLAEGIATRHDLTAYPCYPQVEWFCRFDPESFQNSPERRGELPET